MSFSTTWSSLHFGNSTTF